jgi:hypothetical protein
VLGNSTNFVGVRGFSDNHYGVHGTGGIGVYGNNTANGVAIQVDGTGGPGVVGTSATGFGAAFQGGLAPLRLVRGVLPVHALSAAGHQAGALYVTSDNVLSFFDGTAWRQVLLTPLPSNASPPQPLPPPPTGSAVHPAPPSRSG